LSIHNLVRNTAGLLIRAVVRSARQRPPIDPHQPGEPGQPIDPHQPGEPDRPIDPHQPGEPRTGPLA
jgi:hypothetical protein